MVEREKTARALLCGFAPVLIALALGLSLWVLKSNASAQSGPRGYREGERLYAWGPGSLELRLNPSPRSAVLQRLPYGTVVTVLKQPFPPVACLFEFYARKPSSSAAQNAADNAVVMLEGHWLRVKAANREGYVLDTLLLEIPPRGKAERLDAYLVRVFGLEKGKAWSKRRKNEESGLEYATDFRTWLSKKSGVNLETEKTGGDESTRGHGGRITIPGMTFERAFVFFNGALPPLPRLDYGYREGEFFEYLLDEVGNLALLEKKGQGIVFEWFYGMN